MDTQRWHAYQSVNRKIETQGKGVDKVCEDIPSAQVAVFKRTYVDTLVKVAPPDLYPNIIDIGAGNGAETQALIEAGYNATGIGFGEENISYAKKEFNLNLIELDMHDLSTQWHKETFNGALLCHTFEHSISPFIFLGELYHVLKIGAKVLVDVPSIQDIDMRTIWHTNLLYPDQIKYYFQYWGFQWQPMAIEIQRSQNAYQFLFEKLSPDHPEFKHNYGYLHWILDQLGPNRFFK